MTTGTTTRSDFNSKRDILACGADPSPVLDGPSPYDDLGGHLVQVTFTANPRAVFPALG